MTTTYTILLRRDSATNWSTDNPVLALGEPGWDETNLELKIGDGATAWGSLPNAFVASFNTRKGAVTPGNADYLAVATGGLTGATDATRFVGGSKSGAPTAGTFAVGDFIIDQTGKIWICTAAGTPGTWSQVSGGGGGGGGQPAAISALGTSLSGTVNLTAGSSVYTGTLNNAGTATTLSLPPTASCAGQTITLVIAPPATGTMPAVTIAAQGTDTATAVGQFNPPGVGGNPFIISAMCTLSSATGNWDWEAVTSSLLTSAGDLAYYTGSALARLALGTAGQTLEVNSAGTAPIYGATKLPVQENNATLTASTGTVTMSDPTTSPRNTIQQYTTNATDGNITLAFWATAAAGKGARLVLITDGTRTVTWPTTNVRWVFGASGSGASPFTSGTAPAAGTWAFAIENIDATHFDVTFLGRHA